MWCNSDLCTFKTGCFLPNKDTDNKNTYRSNQCAYLPVELLCICKHSVCLWSWLDHWLMLLTSVTHQHCFNTPFVNVLIGSISVLMFLSGNKPLYRWCHHFRPRWTLTFYSLDQRTFVLFLMEIKRYSDPESICTLQAKPLFLFHALVKILGCFSSIKCLSDNWKENIQNTHFKKFILLHFTYLRL